MNNLNLQQLAGIINDEDKLVKEFIDRELYTSFSIGFEDVLSTSVKLVNERLVQEFFLKEVIEYWVNGEMPESFKLIKELDPREAVEGGWKWNGTLKVDDLLWNNPIFEGKPVVEVTNGFVCYGGSPDRDLIGAPPIVNGNFNCHNNLLVNLKGAPKLISGTFNCSSNELESFDGAPEYVGGDFDSSGNSDLDEDLRPGTEIGGDFYND